MNDVEATLSPIRSMSEEELDRAIQHLTEKYVKPVEEGDTRAVLADCIDLLGGLFAQPTQTTIERHDYFFRARKALTFKTEDETLDPAQYSYLSNKYCTSMGRCHVPRHTVFYGSHNLETAIKEIRPDVGEQLVVSFWVLPPSVVSYLKFVCPSNAEGQVALKRSEVYKTIEAEYPDYGEYNWSRIRAHCRAWSDIFLADNKRTLSASIAHQALYGEYANKSVEGIIYGSAVDPRFLNFALRPDLADKLQLYRVYTCFTTPTENHLFSRDAWS